ncbi:Gfo/Idh/MocA family protein [Pseudalkalibacillus salsuginis]|uniref:Gfo/Idh/MocA family protein n=1 Tax=Pseudalkalibacillus salsuginis TaxID=2910972 RepID=UPI001F254890|nr:Gfo/Idh/MocA family oxidoreductase [Pseudalkalibacillus salsuginis]MCF6408139.1 Gfo/Idh/MocA family oxidoreductase [Pseudalkalibacillus salsuginis]
MVNVALLSKWHVHADDYAKQALENKNVTIKVVWDEDPERGEKWAEELGVPFISHLETVLGDPEIDAVVVDAPTNLHKEIILSAAKYKKHIFTEKVLAFTVKDCEEIYEVVKENGIQLMVSLPRLSKDYYLYAQEIVDQNLLGKLTTIRCRLAHNGAVPLEGKATGWLPDHFFNKEECGGGALIDLGAHPIYLTNRIAGPAAAVTARLQNTLGYEVDDNAVAIVEYESGALGIIEAAFVSSGSPFQLELYGTDGTLLIEDNQTRLKSKRLGEEWVIPDALPESHPCPFNQWIGKILDNEPTSISEADVIGLALINEASKMSHEQSRRITIAEIMNKTKQP